MIKLYENIKELRIRNKWSQDELAHRMGYKDRSMIAKIESGAVDLAESKIIAFAKVLGVKPCDLMGWDSPSASLELSPAASEDEFSALEREIIRRFRKADEFDQETILRTLRIKRDDFASSQGAAV